MNQTDEPATATNSDPVNNTSAENRQTSIPAAGRAGNSRSTGTRPGQQPARAQGPDKDDSITENAQATAPTPEPDADHDSGVDLSPEIQRAEALLDEIGHRAGEQLTDLMRALFRTAVRAQEEAEDIWADANSIRRGH